MPTKAELVCSIESFKKKGELLASERDALWEKRRLLDQGISHLEEAKKMQNRLIVLLEGISTLKWQGRRAGDFKASVISMGGDVNSAARNYMEEIKNCIALLEEHRTTVESSISGFVAQMEENNRQLRKAQNALASGKIEDKL